MKARSIGFRRLVVAVAGLALVAGACTGGSDDKAQPTPERSYAAGHREVSLSTT